MSARANVLVVEDSATAATRLQISLERAGFAVETAKDGGKAWEKAQARQFDFVVTDEQMPVMSGQELTRLLRDLDRYAQTPIIFLTASRVGLNVQELQDKLRVSAIMEKPFSAELITNLIVTKLLSSSRAKSASA